MKTKTKKKIFINREIVGWLKLQFYTFLCFISFEFPYLKFIKKYTFSFI